MEIRSNEQIPHRDRHVSVHTNTCPCDSEVVARQLVRNLLSSRYDAAG
jgi:hypothetical protein